MATTDSGGGGLNWLPATELAAGYAAKRFSPLEVIDAVLDRVRAVEPQVCATYALDEDAARKAAFESEQRWLRGEPAGPLDGVPATVKENIATAGTPVPMGTAATELVPASADAPAAARLRESGAVIFAKTTMPDYGMLSSGRSSFHPLARNPWDLALNPGGSSAGAAAAVSAGYGPLHIGSDIGGSVRLPAGWCGAVGLKASFGRIPVDPPYAGRHIGPLTRTVADAALAASVLSGPDERDHTALPPADLNWTELDGAVAGLRIGLWLDPGAGMPVQPVVTETVTAAARTLEEAGAIVEPIAPILTQGLLDDLDRFWRLRSWLDIAALAPERRDLVLPEIVQWARGGAELTGAQAFTGYSAMDAMAVAVKRCFGSYDFLLSPVAPIIAFPAELAFPTADPDLGHQHIAFTVPFNMSGHPAISVNGGYSAAGLPVGVQFVGRRFDDLGVLRLAAAFERSRPAQRQWPQLVPNSSSGEIRHVS